MNGKQFPFLGLILAILLGPRAVNRGDTPVPSHRGAVTVESRHTPKNSKGTEHTGKTVFTIADAGCEEVPAADLEQRWWLTRGAHGCSLTLSPVWREICKINPAVHSEEEALAPGLSAEEFKGKCLGNPEAVQSMMAAVPNPRHTHLGLMTDRAIEAIQVAASEAHYLPVAHYLPWPSSGAASGSADGDGESAADSADPGVLVFRDVSDPSEGLQRPKYLLVFLIPETPTEGLSRVVFSRAGEMIRNITPLKDKDNVLRFVGPNFSGSVGNLEELQKGLKGTCITAVSGSVTNAADVKTDCLKFTAIQTSDQEALCRFVFGVRAFGYDSREIAILSEEGTQYGRQGPGDKGDQKDAADSPDKDAQTANVPPETEKPDLCAPENKKSSWGELWFLHFPREISKLRNAYGAEVSKSTPADSSSSQDLGLQWQDTEGSQRDDVQTYGERQTPLSQEAVLASLSITLKAQGIKALGILATDPMDEAFLIHSIKRSSPDVRLFVRDPDLLFLRTPDVGSLNGTLLVSNYPLVPENQFWSSPGTHGGGPGSKADDKTGAGQPGIKKASAEHHLITFPSAFQEGEYNAFVELLRDATWAPQEMQRLEWDWPTGMEAEPSASSASNDSKKPGPLWLAVIGTAGHYPIKILNPRAHIDKDGLMLHSLNLGPPQFLPVTFWSLIAGMGLFHALGLRFHQMVPSLFKHDFDLSNKTATVTLVKLFCHLMAIVTITLAQLILGSSYLFFYASDPGYWVPALGVICATAVLLVTCGILLRRIFVLARLQERLKQKDEGSKILPPKRIVRSSVILAVIMIGAGGLWAWMTLGARFDNAFLHFRNLNLSSGVAPTLPIASVLMVLYFGIWAYLRRLSYWEHRYVEMFELKLDPVIRQDLSGDVKAIDACLLGPLENFHWMIAFGAVFGLSLLAFRPWVTLDMIEPSRVWRFALFFFSLALLTLWLNWFRFINIWVHLRAILDHLENLPLRTAFQRLPREKSMPLLQWSSSQNTFLLRQVLDRLRALAKADPTQENQTMETDFEVCLNALLSHGVPQMAIVEQRVVGGSPWPGPQPMPLRRREDHLNAARQEMNDITKKLSDRLLAGYWKRGSSSTAQPSSNPSPSAPDPDELKNVLAEDIVALPFYAYIRKVITELRNILFFLGIAVSLLFAALHTYAFRADQAIDWWFFGLFAVMGLGIVVVIAQVERNALVSRLSNSTPGELGSNFYLQLLKYGMVPILTIFGSQIPFFSNVVLKWVQPALEALH
jgi:hypothetical protein